MGTVVIKYFPETYIDQGGPCGHSDPHTGADDCLCRDGYVTPAYFTTGYTSDYCDGGRQRTRFFTQPHAEHCQYFQPCPF